MRNSTWGLLPTPPQAPGLISPLPAATQFHTPRWREEKPSWTQALWAHPCSRGAQERLSEFTVFTSLLASTHMAPCKVAYISRTFLTASLWILNLFLMKFRDSACSFQCGLQSPAADSGHRTQEVHDLERRENVMCILSILQLKFSVSFECTYWQHQKCD